MATRRKTSSQSTSASPFGYIVFGIVIGLGLAAAGAYYFRTNESGSSQTTAVKPVAPLTAPTVQQPAANTQPASQAPVATPAPPPQSVTQTNTPQAAPQQPVPPATTSTKPLKPAPDQIGALINGMSNKESQKEYIPTYLQVGSFKSAEEADAQRAQLLLQGFSNISILKTKVDNTDFFRVRLGPYSSEQALKDAQNRLKTNSIYATPIR